jgi:hypothetical protein
MSVATAAESVAMNATTAETTVTATAPTMIMNVRWVNKDWRWDGGGHIGRLQCVQVVR